MNSQARDFSADAVKLAQITDVTIDQIRKLAALHKEGILTDEEFAAKKSDLLSQI
jgi:hypothetical protein